MMKKLRRIKWENIYLLLIIFLPVIQYFKAAEEFKIISILVSLTLYSGFYFIIKMIRKGE